MRATGATVLAQRARAALGIGAAIALGIAADARADTASPSPGAGVTGPLCSIKGTWPVPKGTQLFDAPAGGRAIAAFTGAFAPVTLSDLPSDPTVGRARLRTSASAPVFRLDGFVAPSSLPTFTTRDLSIVGGHVWMSSAQKVKLVQAAQNSITAELTIAGSSSQAVRATAPCDAFALQRGTPTAMETPGNGRGYLTKGGSLDLYDQPNGNAVFTLRMMESTSHLFWSTESRNGFVHVMSRADVTIDAWARVTSLEPLKKGEMMDQFLPSTTAVSGAQLGFGDAQPKLVQATKEIPVRFKREDKERPIGVIETGAEVYVMETMAGWSNVLPKHLGFTPGDDGGFWIPSSEVQK
jgi:hypothetical protein